MLILLRKLSTARAAEVNLLCLKVLFPRRGSSRCARQRCGSVVAPAVPQVFLEESWPGIS